MGTCTSKAGKRPNPYAPSSIRGARNEDANHVIPSHPSKSPFSIGKSSPFLPFYTPSPAKHRRSKSREDREGRSVNSTPFQAFRRTLAPASPAKHIRAAWRRKKEKEAEIREEKKDESDSGRFETELDKRFGYSQEFEKFFEVGDELGRGHFGYTRLGKFKKGERKGEQVAVKIIPKAKMTTAVAIEDVRREVMILRALSGHSNVVQFHNAFEDQDNVYVVMELCQGGELLDRILSRGGKYQEEDAKKVIVQILNCVSFCHLQGVVHRDLKPEVLMVQNFLSGTYVSKCSFVSPNNFLYSSNDEDSQLKAIDFGLSDFVGPDERLNDIVGSAYYVAPEVLHRSYNTEADVWSLGVISYILLCGSRPFWARTESGIFRAVLKADPGFEEASWPSLSPQAMDFVRRLLFKDPRKRMTAAQALAHPWIRGHKDSKIPLDLLVLKLIISYLRSSNLRKAALRALSKTLPEDEHFYLKAQFALLGPNKNGLVTWESVKMALTSNATEAMKVSRVPDCLASLGGLQYRGMDFDEFCAAALSIHQFQTRESWEQNARSAYELFEKNGNRALLIEELATELNLGTSIPVHVVLNDWIRHSDGKLSYMGFLKLLHGNSGRPMPKHAEGDRSKRKSSKV